MYRDTGVLVFGDRHNIIPLLLYKVQLQLHDPRVVSAVHGHPKASAWAIKMVAALKLCSAFHFVSSPDYRRISERVSGIQGKREREREREQKLAMTVEMDHGSGHAGVVHF